MFNRRDLFLAAGAAAGAATVLTALPAMAAEAADLPRREVELVAPPFVHAHEQATSRGPEVVAFKMTIIEKEHVIDDDGDEDPRLHLQRLDPRPADGRPRGRLSRAHAGQSADQRDSTTTSTSTLRPAGSAAASSPTSIRARK